MVRLRQLYVCAGFGFALAASACSGNLGSGLSGATPPVTYPVGNNGPVTTSSTAVNRTDGAAVGATPAAATNKAIVAVPESGGLVMLPEGGGYGGTLCLLPVGSILTACVLPSASPAPVGTSAASTSAPSPMPSATASAAAGDVSVKPISAQSIALEVTSHPTGAPPNSDTASVDQGVTQPLVSISLKSRMGVTLPGLSAFALQMPKDEAALEGRHVSFSLYDLAPKNAPHGGIFSHKKSEPAKLAVTGDATKTENVLTFASSTPITLTANHAYLAVLYSNAVAAPTGPASSPVPAGSAVPSTASTPYVSYPAASSQPTPL